MLNLYPHPKARLVWLCCDCYPLLCIMGSHSASSLYYKTEVAEDNQALWTLDRGAGPRPSSPLARKHTAWTKALPLRKW